MKAIRLYSQVLVDVLGAESGSLDQVMAELVQFSAMFAESDLVLKVFDNPTLGLSEKQAAFEKLASRLSLSPSAKRFLLLLIERNRLSILAEIIQRVEVIQVEKKGGVIGQLISAVPVDGAIADGVAQALSKKLNKPVQLKQKVDPGLIAGMRVELSGVTYDGSVQGKLDRLAEKFH